MNHRYILAASLAGSLAVAAAFGLPAPSSMERLALEQFQSSISVDGSIEQLETEDPGTAESCTTSETCDDPYADTRLRMMLDDGPDFSFLRLDKRGGARVRIDVYCGADSLPSENLQELVQSFRFGIQGEEQEVTSSDCDSRQDSESLTIPVHAPPRTGVPTITVFDPQLDVAIAFQDAGDDEYGASSCLLWWVEHEGYRHTNEYYYVQPSGFDTVVASAQARRDKNTNPNTYLYYWSTSQQKWILTDSSASGNYMDTVRGMSSSCQAIDWRTKIFFANEGYYSFHVTAYRQN